MRAFLQKLMGKLTSRKLWAALITVVIAAAAVCLDDALSPEAVEALRCAAAASIAYIFGESAVDIAGMGK